MNNSNSANTLLTTSAINVNATGVGIGIEPASTLHINMGTDKNIQFSAGTAYNKFKKLPLFFWINFDGLDHINWYSGFGLRFKNYDFNFGISQVDGFLNSSKGLSIGLSQSFKF